MVGEFHHSLLPCADIVGDYLVTEEHQPVDDTSLEDDGVVAYCITVLRKEATSGVARDSTFPGATRPCGCLNFNGVAAVHGDAIRDE